MLRELEKLCKPASGVVHNLGNSAVMTFELKEPATGPDLLLKERFIVCMPNGDILKAFDEYPSKQDTLDTMLKYEVPQTVVKKVTELINVVRVISDACDVFENQMGIKPTALVLHPTLLYALRKSERVRGAIQLEPIDDYFRETYLGMVLENARNDYDEHHALTLRGYYK